MHKFTRLSVLAFVLVYFTSEVFAQSAVTNIETTCKTSGASTQPESIPTVSTSTTSYETITTTTTTILPDVVILPTPAVVTRTRSVTSRITEIETAPALTNTVYETVSTITTLIETGEPQTVTNTETVTVAVSAGSESPLARRASAWATVIKRQDTSIEAASPEDTFPVVVYCKVIYKITTTETVIATAPARTRYLAPGLLLTYAITTETATSTIFPPNSITTSLVIATEAVTSTLTPTVQATVTFTDTITLQAAEETPST